MEVANSANIKNKVQTLQHIYYRYYSAKYFLKIHCTVHNYWFHLWRLNRKKWLPVNSSHGQLVTGQLVTQSTRHAVDSSQRDGQLVTSKQTSKHPSRTAAAVITLTHSPRSPPLLKKCTRKWAGNKVLVCVHKPSPLRFSNWKVKQQQQHRDSCATTSNRRGPTPACGRLHRGLCLNAACGLTTTSKAGTGVWIRKQAEGSWTCIYCCSYSVPKQSCWKYSWLFWKSHLTSGVNVSRVAGWRRVCLPSGTSWLPDREPCGRHSALPRTCCRSIEHRTATLHYV